MCGIAGIINLEGTSPKEWSLKRMMDAIKHRGPDDEGVYVSEDGVGFGFVRLSILDLSEAGHQPMFSEDENLVVVFNGEIFNYIELRDELKIKGHKFKTGTDTEVLIRSYQEWGEDCLNRFNGMWAFAIYDIKNKTVFAARDRYGIKPFYYFSSDKELIFASEIPAILEVLERKPKPNNQTIFDFLVFNRTDQNENTFFDGIKKLQHGFVINIDLKKEKNKVTVKKWYDLRSNLKEAFSSKEEYYSYLKSAVDLRMRSDVPVGVCLSGGLDSSSILSILLTDKSNAGINTFSAVYNIGDIGDETEFINQYRNAVQNMHFVKPDGETFYDDIKRFVKAHSEPIPSTSAYAQYRVMALAKGKVTVTLDGQGADEQLAGYHYFFGLYFKELLFRLRIGKLIYEMFAYYKNHRSFFAIKSFVFFLLPKQMRTKVRVSEKGYLTNNFSEKHNADNSIAGNLYGSKNLKEALLDHFEYKLEHHLKWGDFNSMSHSIESRVPFLDHNLVERSLSLPSSKLIKNGKTKHILREAMKGVLPEMIRNRADKIGFGTPEAKWFKSPLFKEFILSILNSESFERRGIIDPKKAKNLYQKHIDGVIDISKEIWKWVHLELWFREFIDEKTKDVTVKQVCKLGIWDDSIPEISFDENGISNYAKLQQKLMADYPRGEVGKRDWESIVAKMKKSGKNKKYDCIVGVSGGVDSSYLLFLAKEYGLRPLAVHLDNGFNSEIAVGNIYNIINALNIDLKTHVINYEEIKDLLRSYMEASLPWVDFPTDLAIKATMYDIAIKENIKYILRGNDFRSEVIHPTNICA